MIKPHPTWEIIDSSKVTAFITCPRKYFYKYILGWVGEDISVHLVFGEGWHRAMEKLLKEGYTTDAVHSAYSAFLEYYRRYFTKMEDANFFPKAPSSVVPALIEYIERYRESDRNMEVLYTEISGTAPIGEDRVIHFRMDGVVKREEGIVCLEHKTGSRLTGNWGDQWTLKVATGTYMHVLNCLYSPEEVYGLIINGAIFRKSGNDFVRFPIRKNNEMMNQWLWNVNHWIDLIEWNMKELESSSENDDILYAFPLNPESCTKWGRMCPFHDFCFSWGNPLKRCDEVPYGFKQEWWNPADREKESGNVVHLESESTDEK